MLKAIVHRAGCERGASLVEAALVLPIFFALVLGMFTFGDAYFARISIEDAVRDGTRFGATLTPFDEDVVKDRIRELAGGELDGAGSVICVKKVETPAGGTECPGVSDPAGASGPIIKVYAKASKHIEAIFFSRDIDITAQATGAYER